MKPALSLLLAAPLLATLLAAPAHAEVYKWKDANGRIQFSDKPPPDQKGVQQLDLKNTTVSPADKAAADQRAANLKAVSEKSDDAKTAAAKAAPKEKPDPDAGKSELQKSEECFAKYRTTTGRLLPEAGEKCKEVKIP